MSGTINLSLTQQLDEYGQPLSGGSLYIIQAGTVATPQQPYQDSALTILQPNPIPLDAAGRIPQFFLSDGQIKVRLQDKNGVVKFTADNLLVIGPSGGGGGGGGTVDPTTVWQTGDLKVRYDTAIVAGFVRANGKTIGSALSGATELADATAQALFQFLWQVDSNLVVTPSRGATAAADWTAAKQIALPDWRGCALGALDDMGNAAAGRLTAAYFGTSPIVLGARGGGQSMTLLTANLPPYAPSGTVSASQSGSTATIGYAFQTTVAYNPSTGSPLYTASANAGSTNISVNAGGISASFTGAAQGGTSTPFAVVQPTKLATVYIKL
jgi:hypothetical protein